MAKLISKDEKKFVQNLFVMPATVPISKKGLLKQINTLKPFDMEPRKAIRKKHFVLEEQNNCEEEINLTPQDRIGNTDWC